MIEFNDGPGWLNARIGGVKKAYKIPHNTEKFNIAIDIGANVGAFPIVNHDKFKRIVCIEPSNYSVNECIKNTKRFENVEVYNLAVSDKDDDIIKLRSCLGANTSGNASTVEHKSWNDDNYELIKTISYKGLFERFGIDKIDYLKIDCEGGEYDFLMNQDLSNIDYLGIEIHVLLNEKLKILENYIKKYFDIIYETGNGVTINKEYTFKNKNL